MKRVYMLGRYKNVDTGKRVNIWKMRRGSFDVLAYLPQGKDPVVISDKEFYSDKKWIKETK